MSKKAAIIMGSQDQGKSTTINKFLKPLLNMKQSAYLFCNKRGYIRSQSLEESGIDLDELMEKCKEKYYVVLACRPRNEKNSKIDDVTKKLIEQNFGVEEYDLKERTDKHQIKVAEQVYQFLDLKCH
ncbi:MAG: hypothetical protein OIF32_04340 [Campylobacterales bacterium]|nr:hypothetical protein [Campylobacterales bacterium]